MSSNQEKRTKIDNVLSITSYFESIINSIDLKAEESLIQLKLNNHQKNSINKLRQDYIDEIKRIQDFNLTVLKNTEKDQLEVEHDQLFKSFCFIIDDYRDLSFSHKILGLLVVTDWYLDAEEINSLNMFYKNLVPVKYKYETSMITLDKLTIKSYLITREINQIKTKSDSLLIKIDKNNAFKIEDDLVIDKSVSIEDIAPDVFMSDYLKSIRKLKIENIQLDSNNFNLALKEQKILFNGLNNLEELHLIYDQDTCIYSNFFNGLDNLKVLHLENKNNYEAFLDGYPKLDRNLFTGLNNLEELIIDDRLIYEEKDIGLNCKKSIKNLKLSHYPRGYISTYQYKNLNQLDLTNCGMKTSLDCFNFLEKLECLILNGNTINYDYKKEPLGNLKRLKKLHLQRTHLNFVYDGLFDGLFNLQDLDLSNNDIKMLQLNVFDDLYKLKILDLQCCDKIEFYRKVEDFSDKQKLNKHVNGERFEEEEIGPTSLESLNINFNSFEVMKKYLLNDLGEIKNLSLYGHFNQNKCMNDKIDIDKLETLEKLNINCKFSHSIDIGYFKNLKNLIELDLNIVIASKDNSSETFFNDNHDLTHLDKLERLNITKLAASDLGLDKRLECFKYFLSLKVLNINHSNIKAINAFSNNHFQINLRVLSLKNNNIDKLFDGMFSGCRLLEELDISKNKINTIEDSSFEHLNILKKLNIGENSISNLSYDLFKDLVSLEELSLSFNEINCIGDGTFNYLENLDILNLSRNQITEIGDLTFDGLFENLKELDLSSNKINKISNCAFEKFKRLERAKLRENLINDIEYRYSFGDSPVEKEFIETKWLNPLLKL